MNNKETYEVERDEYVGFIDIIKADARDTKQIENEDYKIYEIYSKKTKKLLCERIISNKDDIERFYIYAMPDDDERQNPKAIRKITLESKEEVQAFFDILSKIQKGDKANE